MDKSRLKIIIGKDGLPYKVTNETETEYEVALDSAVTKISKKSITMRSGELGYEGMDEANNSRKPIEVFHSQLARANEKNDLRSNCPVCSNGVLAMKRDEKTGKLLAMDTCLGCGQAFIYRDMEYLNSIAPVEKEVQGAKS